MIILFLSNTFMVSVSHVHGFLPLMAFLGGLQTIPGSRGELQGCFMDGLNLLCVQCSIYLSDGSSVNNPDQSFYNLFKCLGQHFVGYMLGTWWGTYPVLLRYKF